jgi:hypothetical protein
MELTLKDSPLRMCKGLTTKGGKTEVTALTAVLKKKEIEVFPMCRS